MVLHLATKKKGWFFNRNIKFHIGSKDIHFLKTKTKISVEFEMEKNFKMENIYQLTHQFSLQWTPATVSQN